MKESFFEINLRDFARYTGLSVTDKVADDFFIADIDNSKHYDVLDEPCRFNGYLAFFCLEGSFTLEVNLKRYEVKENSLVINVPGNIWRVNSINHEHVHLLVVAVSSDFLSGVRFDLNSMFEDSLSVLDNPCIELHPEEADICHEYFALASKLAGIGTPGVKNALQLLVSSTFHMLASMWDERITDARNHTGRRTSRSKQTFDSFISLVQKYHGEQRGVAWYADKLNLTPKYLSKLVKEVSGQSAPEWIDSFVILEAKNLLRYSEQPIKAISAGLGFSSPAAFHAFFKARTGMTPMTYREK